MAENDMSRHDLRILPDRRAWLCLPSWPNLGRAVDFGLAVAPRDEVTACMFLCYLYVSVGA